VSSVIPLGIPPSLEHEPLFGDPPVPPASRTFEEPPLPEPLDPPLPADPPAELDPALPVEPPEPFDPPLAFEPPVPLEPPLPLVVPAAPDEPMLSNDPLLPVEDEPLYPDSPPLVMAACDPIDSGMSSPVAHPTESRAAAAPKAHGTVGKRTINFDTPNLVRCRSTPLNARRRWIDHRDARNRARRRLTFEHEARDRPGVPRDDGVVRGQNER
jgi:hypothetical protein